VRINVKSSVPDPDPLVTSMDPAPDPSLSYVERTEKMVAKSILIHNFPAKNLILIIKNMLTILKLLNFIYCGFWYGSASGSVSQRYGSEDPDPHSDPHPDPCQHVTDLETRTLPNKDKCTE
jgi:hypothetical protein